MLGEKSSKKSTMIELKSKQLNGIQKQMDTLMNLRIWS